MWAGTPEMSQHLPAMTPFPPLFRAWTQAVLRPVFLAWTGLAGVALLAVVSQVLSRVPLVPSPMGVAAVSLGLLPEVGAIMLPVALFLGTLTVARRWSQSGDLAAMYAAGLGARVLVPQLLLLGLLGAGLTATLSHSVAPAGRALAREALARASGDLRLVAGRPTWVGDTLVRAGAVQDRTLGEVFVAQGDVVASAPVGIIGAGGTVTLQRGGAQGIGSDPWMIEFETLRLPLRLPPPRVHAFDMSDASLASLIHRMEAAGKSAHSERLVLIKRTTLALASPLLMLLALPLGARSRWVGVGGVGTILGLWGLQRVGDHLARSWGSELSASLPLCVLSVVVAVAWLSWRER